MENTNFVITRNIAGGKSAKDFWTELRNAPKDENGNLTTPISLYVKKEGKMGGSTTFAKSPDDATEVAKCSELNEENIESKKIRVIQYFPQVEGQCKEHAVCEFFFDSSAQYVPKPKSDIIKETSMRTGLSEDDVKERLSLISQYGIKKGKWLERVAAKIARQPDGEAVQKPEKLFTEGKERVVWSLLVAAATGNHVCLEGSKSVGKNVAWETVSYLLNRKIFSLQCSFDMSIESVFGHVGTNNRKPMTVSEISDAISDIEISLRNGTSIADALAPIIASHLDNLSPSLGLVWGVAGRAMLHENAGFGSILLLDEMNLSNPSTFASLFNQLTDKHSEYLSVDTESLVIPHDMMIGGTQNTLGGNYFGTNALNDASMSRWLVKKVHGLASIAGLIRESGIEITDEDTETLDNLYKSFTVAVNSGEVSDSALNIRGFLSAADMVSAGETMLNAVTMMINTIADEDERGILYEICMTHC